MLELILVTALAGAFLDKTVLIYFLIKNRPCFSAHLPEQIRIYRWVFAATRGLLLTGVVAFIIYRFTNMSEGKFLIVWGVIYIGIFIGLYEYAKMTITEWFIPNSRKPQQPLSYVPKRRSNLLIVLAVYIVLALFLLAVW